MEFNLGYKKDGTVKHTLSWSGYNMWVKNKDSYRKRYYRGEKVFENPETIFGKKVANMLELSDHIKGSETRIEIKLKNGLGLISYLDEFDEETFTIGEYKTGHETKDGKAPWNQVLVEKHKQLDFYSMMVKKKYGKVNNKVKLTWLETRFKTKTVEFDGHTLSTKSRELELTGRREVFTRTIYQWQRDKIEKDIIRVAYEIHEDFKKFSTEKSFALK